MDEETKKAIADAVAEATKGLRDKNAELIGEIRQLKTDKQAAEDAAEEAAHEAASKAGDIDAITTGLEKKHKSEIDKLNEQLTKLNGELSTLKIDNVIAEAITGAGVLAHHAPILSTFLRSGATMKDGEAMVGDITLADHLSGFLTSDAAKHYIAAPANSGAGAIGSSTSAAAHGYTKDSFTLTEYSKLAKEKGVDHANSIATSVGAPFRTTE